MFVPDSENTVKPVFESGETVLVKLMDELNLANLYRRMRFLPIAVWGLRSGYFPGSRVIEEPGEWGGR